MRVDLLLTVEDASVSAAVQTVLAALDEIDPATLKVVSVSGYPCDDDLPQDPVPLVRLGRALPATLS